MLYFYKDLWKKGALPMIRNGIDLVEIARVQKSAEKPSFLNKVYGAHELAAFGGKVESLAGAFAAKEAFAKALGTGIRGFSLSEVQVLHDALGAPYFALSGRAQEIADSLHLEFALSITHTQDYAAAMVTAVEKETL